MGLPAAVQRQVNAMQSRDRVEFLKHYNACRGLLRRHGKSGRSVRYDKRSRAVAARGHDAIAADTKALSQRLDSFVNQTFDDEALPRIEREITEARAKLPDLERRLRYARVRGDKRQAERLEQEHAEVKAVASQNMLDRYSKEKASLFLAADEDPSDAASALAVEHVAAVRANGGTIDFKTAYAKAASDVKARRYNVKRYAATQKDQRPKVATDNPSAKAADIAARRVVEKRANGELADFIAEHRIALAELVG
jgi:hypothetical protein